MAWHLTDSFGITQFNPDLALMADVIESVFEARDAEFQDVSLFSDSGWTLCYNEKKTMVLENLNDKSKGIRFLRDVSIGKAVRMWEYLASENIKAILEMPWVVEVS